MKLYRSMLVDPADGLPVAGSAARMLGVRVPPSDPADVSPDADGRVIPGTGGMSVVADDPRHLPLHLRPERLRGRLLRERGDVFEADSDSIVAPLEIRPDGPPHHLVEPWSPMPVTEFQAALHATRRRWRIVP